MSDYNGRQSFEVAVIESRAMQRTNNYSPMRSKRLRFLKDCLGWLLFLGCLVQWQPCVYGASSTAEPGSADGVESTITAASKDNKVKLVTWLTDRKSGLSQAKAQRKRMLVEVGAQWCPDCRRLESSIIPDAAVQKFLRDNYVCVKLDADGRPGTRMQKHYGNHAIPTLYVFSTTGKYLGSKAAEHVEPASFVQLLLQLQGQS